MIKYLAFDFDGTLVHSQIAFVAVYNRLAEKYGLQKMEPAQIPHLRTLSIKERFRFLRIPFYKIPFFTAEFLKQYQQSIPDIYLIAGIQEALQALKEHEYQLAIISSNTEGNIRRFLQHNQLDIISDVFCSTNIFEKEKVIRKVLKAYNLKPSEVLYVGDEQRDIIACRKNGVKVVWVSLGYDVPQSLTSYTPDFIADTPADLLNIMDNQKNHTRLI